MCTDAPIARAHFVVTAILDADDQSVAESVEERKANRTLQSHPAPSPPPFLTTTSSTQPRVVRFAAGRRCSRRAWPRVVSAVGSA